MSKWWVYPALLSLSASAIAFDVNIQYVQSSNALMADEKAPVFRSEVVERTLSASRNIFVSDLTSLDASISLYEHLTAKYSALSYSSIGSALTYEFQSDFDLNTPFYTLEVRGDYTFIGNPVFRGVSINTNAARYQQISDRWQWQTAISVENQWRADNELEERSIFLGTGLDYRVNSNLYLYGFGGVQAGFFNLDTVEPGISAQRNNLLSEQTQESWFVENEQGVLSSAIFGTNMPLAEDLTLDVAVEAEYGQISATSISKLNAYFSFYFRF